MAAPFSNTHLRVPHGFGTLLEGLAREVLRDQPEDIPAYAAQHFEALLKEREESGLDPAEWAAKLEDRYYNNHAFKQTSPGPATDVTKEKSIESQPEDESSQSEEAPPHTSTNPNSSEEVDLTESMEEEERHYTQQEQSVNVLPVANVELLNLSGSEEDKDPAVAALDQADRAANENDNSTFSNQTTNFEVEAPDSQSFSGTANVDVCALELGEVETQGQSVQEEDTENVEREFMDSEAEEQMGEIMRIAEKVAFFEEHSSALPVEEDIETPELEEEFLQSCYSQLESLQDSLQEAEEQTHSTGEEEGIETEEASETVAVDDSSIPKEEFLVEISFEDVPEAQQIVEVKIPGGEHESLEVLPSQISEVKQHEDSDVTEVATAEDVFDVQDHDEPKMEQGEMEVSPETEEMESQQKASEVAKENVDTNDSHSNGSNDNEKEEGVKNRTTHQPTTDAENLEDKNSEIIDENEKISDSESRQREVCERKATSDDPDEATDTVEENKEDIHTDAYLDIDREEINEGESENNLANLTQSNVVTAGLDEESETLDTSAHDLIEENEEELKPEDTLEEKMIKSQELTSEVEEHVEDLTKAQAKSEEGDISQDDSAKQMDADLQQEQRSHGSKEDTAEPEAENNDKQEECSRPQEEEDIMDIPLDDPEANRAAAKIQAGFRGHMTRKKMKPEDKTEGEEVSSTGEVLNGSQGDTETGGSGAVERDDTSVPEQ